MRSWMFGCLVRGGRLWVQDTDHTELVEKGRLSELVRCMVSKMERS